jgi:filamentous hemagglutinin
MEICMPKLPSWTYPTVALLLLAGIGISRLDFAPQPESGNAAVADTYSDSSQVSAPVWSHGADGASANAEEHWEKHGREFSQYHSAGDYERGAQDFVDHPPPGTNVKHRKNGDTVLYDPDSNTFAVVDPKGEPRTMFKPHNGKKYWAHQ